MMKNIKWIGLAMLLSQLLVSCGPKSETTAAEELSIESKAWIPFAGTESVTFEMDTATMTCTGQEKETWFDNVRYMTDQSGFITTQKDFYADLERQALKFTSPSTNFFINYSLERNKGETGDWDIFRLQLTEGNYYTNEMKIVIFETDNYDKGEHFSYKKNLALNGQSFTDVYYIRQERRPFELYYTRQQGVVGFKLNTNELWTIAADTLQ